jgi:hypothetical protein
MPRAKTKPKDPIESYRLSDKGLMAIYELEIMPSDWNILGRGSHKKKNVIKKVDAFITILADDFIDKNGNLIPIKESNLNTYLTSSIKFSTRMSRKRLGTEFESDQQIRKVYYKIIAKKLIQIIYIHTMYHPIPLGYPIENLLKRLDKLNKS